MRRKNEVGGRCCTCVPLAACHRSMVMYSVTSMLLLLQQEVFVFIQEKKWQVAGEATGCARLDLLSSLRFWF